VIETEQNKEEVERFKGKTTILAFDGRGKSGTKKKNTVCGKQEMLGREGWRRCQGTGCDPECALS